MALVRVVDWRTVTNTQRTSSIEIICNRLMRQLQRTMLFTFMFLLMSGLGAYWM